MSNDWQTWIGGVNPQARDGLIHMLGVCVDDCEYMAKRGREALAALDASTAYWSEELEEAADCAVSTMENYQSFPLDALMAAMADWQKDSGSEQRQALAKAEAKAAEALAEVARLRSVVDNLQMPTPATLE
jgi:hypothetical protein